MEKIQQQKVFQDGGGTAYTEGQVTTGRYISGTGTSAVGTIIFEDGQVVVIYTIQDF